MTADTTFFIPRRSARISVNGGGLVREHVPAELANQIASIVDSIFRSDGELATYLFRQVWMSLGRDPRHLRAQSWQQREALQALLIGNGGVTDFLDTVELLAKGAARMEWGAAYVLLRRGSDEAFVLSRFGYRFVGDEIVEAGTNIENQAVDEARDALLGDPRFADAEGKFVSALRKATSGRAADYPEAVHAAASAIEEVARELLSDSKIGLNRALEKLRTEHDLEPSVTEAMKKLYHLRGDLEGAAHGAAAGSEPIARFAVHTAAAGMLYLIAECT